MLKPTPYEFLFGIDIALKKIRPYANFQLEGNKFTVWNDPTGTEPPAWEEINAQIAKDEAAYKTYHDIVEEPRVETDHIVHDADIQPELPDTPTSLKRLEICQTCASFVTPIKMCKECHCFMPWKTKFTDAVCPVGKW